jgi:type I restriction enzyme S subunit
VTIKDDDKQTLTPTLRFPEFRATPGWAETPLEDVVSPIVRERQKPTTLYTGLGIRSHGKGTFLKPLAEPEKTSMERLYEVDVDDLIVNITFAWEGAVAIVGPEAKGALVSHRFPTFKFNPKAAVPAFFRYTILDKQFIYRLGVISPGGAGRNRVLNKRDFLKLKVPVPRVAEQRKIAECLGSLDELIAAEGRKLEALRAHKKGLMQHLFPREAETRPRLRFPEFQGPWPSAKMSSLLREARLGGNYENSEANDGVPVIKMGNIERGAVTAVRLQYLPKGVQYDSDDVLHEGDLLFNTRNTLDLVGKVAIWRNELPKALYNSNLMRFRFSGEFEESNQFANYLFNTDVVVSRLRALATGTTSVAAIYGRDLANLHLTYPTPEEQRRIAACLSSLDAVLAGQSQKLAALKTHKKALMQQLFPSVAE